MRDCNYFEEVSVNAIYGLAFIIDAVVAFESGRFGFVGFDVVLSRFAYYASYL